jgi:tetratricopeptide (TPR) repeat protein
VLFDHTGGHPLFTVELLRAMQARGDLIQDDAGYWTEGTVLDWEALPARVEGVIEERVSRLEPELREILSVASVEGEDFTAQVVAEVQEVSERQLFRALSQELQKRHRLVREQGAVPVGQKRLSRYRFAHALFQQYLYNNLGEGERTLLHGQIAAELEGLYEGQRELVAVQLAHHYSKAGDDQRSLKYYALAGEVALASYANREAEEHYQRALELASAAPQRAHLLSGLGQALWRQSRFREALQTWREGIKLYTALEDFESVARLYSRSAFAAWDAGDAPESLRLCQEGLAALTDAPESVGLAYLLWHAGGNYVHSGLMDEGLPLSRQALEMAERLGAVEVQALVLASLGYYGGLSPEESLELLMKAMALAEGAGLLDTAALVHNNLGTCMMFRWADARTARDHHRRSAELLRQVGRTVGQVFALASAAIDSQFLGEFAEAEATLSHMRHLLSQLTEPGRAADNLCVCEIRLLGHRGEWVKAARLARALQADTRERGSVFLSVARYLLAWVVLESYSLGGGTMVGGWEEAEAALVEAIQDADRPPYYFHRVEMRTFLGALYVYQGRLEEARRVLVVARDKAGSVPTAWDEQSLLWLMARLARAEERWSEALSAFGALVGIHESLGWRWRRARALLDWAEVHVIRGEPGDLEQAEVLLRQSRAMFEEMGLSRFVALTEQRLHDL